MCIVLKINTIAARIVVNIQMKISGCASSMEENNLHHAKLFRATVTYYFKTVREHTISILYVQNDHTPLTIST
jgi:hypothetical protein